METEQQLEKTPQKEDGGGNGVEGESKIIANAGWNPNQPGEFTYHVAAMFSKQQHTKALSKAVNCTRLILIGEESYSKAYEDAWSVMFSALSQLHIDPPEIVLHNICFGKYAAVTMAYMITTFRILKSLYIRGFVEPSLNSIRSFAEVLGKMHQLENLEFSNIPGRTLQRLISSIGRACPNVKNLVLNRTEHTAWLMQNLMTTFPCVNRFSLIDFTVENDSNRGPWMWMVDLESPWTTSLKILEVRRNVVQYRTNFNADMMGVTFGFYIATHWAMKCLTSLHVDSTILSSSLASAVMLTSLRPKLSYVGIYDWDTNGNEGGGNSDDRATAWNHLLNVNPHYVHFKTINSENLDKAIDLSFRGSNVRWNKWELDSTYDFEKTTIQAQSDRAQAITLRTFELSILMGLPPPTQESPFYQTLMNGLKQYIA